METTLEGRIASLPDGQRVRIESVNGAWATVRRIGGTRHGSLAVCAIANVNRSGKRHLPRMREHGLIIDELPDEVLVYDLDRHEAHCLNRTAALVWRRCDGKTRSGEIARRLQSELNQPFNEDLVWLALRQLNQIHLLAEPVDLPPKLAGISRRNVMRTLGIAAMVAAPLVTSVVAPTATEAATCAGNNQPCTSKACCSGFTCDPATKRCV